MAIDIKKGYFNYKLVGGLPDREYPVAVDREFYKSFFTEGINIEQYGQLAVDSVSNQSVFILGGVLYLEGNILAAVPLDPSDTLEFQFDPEGVVGIDRIDLLIAEIDDNDVDPDDVRDIQFKILKGVPDASPVAPTIETDFTNTKIKQQIIHEVLIVGGQGQINPGDVTDRRTFSEVKIFNLVNLDGSFVMPTAGYSTVGTVRESGSIPVSNITINEKDSYTVKIADSDSTDLSKAKGLANAGIITFIRVDDNNIKVRLEDETKLVAGTNMKMIQLKNKGGVA